uniref:Protein indeterminate-domain 6, chloroplastic-like n=1 Tax=Elaeis guineensis var. tenera TaxID=51953 RepID=A0A8N4EW83_ELAGV|nr:protein indeterminate-domain 6, chloroplastic-like [Elaeis guineensis]
MAKDPTAEVVALSPERLLATGVYVCGVCKRGFERDQNLQLHKRSHNLVVSLKKSGTHKKRKRVYVCPEPSCVYHDPTRALGDITGIKKHYLRKHCSRRWRCENCGKMYAVEADMKVHFNRCSTGNFRKRSCAAHQKDCNVANPRGVPMMAHEGGNGVSNVVQGVTASNASHPLMAPSFANFNEGMGSNASWTTGGYAVGGEWNAENYAGPGGCVGNGAAWFGGNDSGLPPMDALAYMSWMRF